MDSQIGQTIDYHSLAFIEDSSGSERLAFIEDSSASDRLVHDKLRPVLGVWSPWALPVATLSTEPHGNSLEDTLTCTTCIATFCSTAMKVHLSVCPHKVLECHLCLRTFPDTISLNSHKRFDHTMESFSCPQCKREFRTQQGLNFHRKAKHVP